MKKTLILFVLMAATAFSQPGRMRGPGPEGGMPFGAGMIKQLQLTDDQQKKFDDLRADVEKKQVALRSKIETMRIDLAQLFKADKPDQGKIESQIAEIGKIQTEMKQNMVGHWFGVHKMLTPEQQKIWNERRPMPGGGMGPGKGGECDENCCMGSGKGHRGMRHGRR